jgi:hypothetical protein
MGTCATQQLFMRYQPKRRIAKELAPPTTSPSFVMTANAVTHDITDMLPRAAKQAAVFLLPINLPKHDIQAPQDRADVGKHMAAVHVIHCRQMREARRANLAAVRLA